MIDAEHPYLLPQLEDETGRQGLHHQNQMAGLQRDNGVCSVTVSESITKHNVDNWVSSKYTVDPR